MENTIRDISPVGAVKDHLHIRGEYLVLALYVMHLVGSPPHTWRIPASLCFVMVLVRITSTYVENTRQGSQLCWFPWDHLHIRGEYRMILINVKAQLGSPPHTWRIHSFTFMSFTVFRITSTYVENTTVFRFNFF